MFGAGAIITLSFLFSMVSRRTNVPTVLMLMALGYLIGQFVPLGEGYDAIEKTALSLLGTVGVILIVLEAALDLHLEKENVGMIIKSVVLASAMLGVTSLLIAISLVFFLDLGWLQGWLYAVPLAVMSSAIIIPSVGGLAKGSRDFLTFESAFSDILGIVLFYALAGAADPGHEGSLFLGSLNGVALTLVLSVVLTYLLIIFFQAVEGHVKLFFLIGILIMLYGAGKYFHLSPLLLILIFGLGLNNKNLFFRGSFAFLIHDETFDNIVKDFRIITLESAFVVRTFFFVVFGISITLTPLLDPWVWVITLCALVAIYVPRFIGLKLAGRTKVSPEIYVAPRGLITVLLFYGIPENMLSEQFNTGILVLTILVTSFVMSFGLILDGRKSSSSKGGKPGKSAGEHVDDPLLADQPEASVLGTSSDSSDAISDPT